MTSHKTNNPPPGAPAAEYCNPEGTYTAQVWIDGSGIVHLIKSGYQELDDAYAEERLIVAFLKEQEHLSPAYLCVDASDLRGISRETRELQSELMETSPFRAVAAHGIGVIIRVIATVFAKRSQERPIKLFGTEADALKYLDGYRNRESSLTPSSPTVDALIPPNLESLRAQFSEHVKTTQFGDREYQTMTLPQWRFENPDGSFATFHTLVGTDTIITTSSGYLTAEMVEATRNFDQDAVRALGVEKLYFIHDTRTLSKVDRAARAAVRSRFEDGESVQRLSIIVGKPMHMIMLRWIRALAPRSFQDWLLAPTIEAALEMITEHRVNLRPKDRQHTGELPSRPQTDWKPRRVTETGEDWIPQGRAALVALVKEQRRQLDRHDGVLDLIIERLGRLSWDASALSAQQPTEMEPPFELVSGALNLLGADVSEIIGSLNEHMARLQKSQNHLETAQRIAHLGSWEWDIASGALTWSDETFRIFGYEPNTVQPTYAVFLDHLSPETRPLVEEGLEAAISEGIPFDSQQRVVRKDGTERITANRGYVERGEAGQPVRMHGTTHDITDVVRARAAERRAMAELSDREASLRETLLDLSHDVRTPLASLKLGIGRLGDDGSNIDLKSPLIAELEYLDGLFANLIALVRYKSSTIQLKKHPICANDVLERVESRLGILADHRSVSLDFAAFEGDLMMLADPLALEQAVGNLVHNAIKFAAGNVAVLIDQRSEWVVFEVRDDGPGMSIKDIPRVTDRYYRGVDRKDSSGRGLGLGLPIAKAIVEEHGGTLEISTGTQAGTNVHVKLPLLP